jgi:DNA repair exonuclease SbcCD ATPase subunit
MINLINVTMKNFLSIGNNTQAVKLNGTGLTLVIGNNIDMNNGKNGVGKSSLIQAISYGLYGKPLTKIKLPNLVNNINKKGMVVTIEFERNGKTYRVERGQKPAFMRLFADNDEIGDSVNDAQGENKHTQDTISNLIGMSHSLFKHIVAMNTFTEPFLKMSVGDQRIVIEELLGVTQISDRAEILRKLIGDTKDSMRDEDSDIRATIEANSRIHTALKRIIDTSDAWEKSKNNILSELQIQIETLAGIDFEHEISVFDKQSVFDNAVTALKHNLSNESLEATRLRHELNSCDTEIQKKKAEAERSSDPMISRMQLDISRKQKDIDRNLSKIKDAEKSLALVKDDLSRADSQDCVSCGQKLHGTDHLKKVIANLEKKAKEFETVILAENKEIKTRQSEIATINLDIEQAKEDAVLRSDILLAEIATLSEKSATVKQQLDVHTDAEKLISIEIASLGKRPETMFPSRHEVYKMKQAFDTITRDLEVEAARENPHLDQIASMKETIKLISYDCLNDLDGLYRHQDFLLRLLTSKDSFIRKRIIDQNLHYLNTRLNYYLEKLGLAHEVVFMSDLSVDISILGVDMDFEQLSRGEMNRVIMGTSWAFRDVWESLNSPINAVMIDEMLDQGTDEQGVNAAIEILKKMSRDRRKNVTLISHRDDLTSRIDSVLMVTKENGFTKFEAI